MAIAPLRVACGLPSTYSVWVLPAPVRTARCHLPSLTGADDSIGSGVPFQNSALRSPPLPMYSDGVYWPAVVPLPTGSAEELKITPPPVVVLNQALTDW